MQNHELYNGELRVPRQFVDKYWKSIPNPVVMTLPNGVQKEIFWIKRDGDVWFQKNWEKMAKFLKFGYVVFFKYMGGSCFKLEILGLNSLEIDYSNIKFIDQVENNDNGAEFVEVSDDDIEMPKSKKSKRTRKGKGKGKISSNVGGMNPFFELTLTKTTAKGYLFRIPCKFSRRYMGDFEGIARIRIFGEKRIWKVTVKYDHELDYTIVNRGWKPFAEEYNLQTGDVCKFEMTRSGPISFTITINRVGE
ncbi:B3 domain-containing transcription factor VRN1-like [Trifolium pratense]|uniref:B3 domain-containing transcription factor VRN1-like n=1 Tax=Trifolium pratense TaxID=57577 RepID=UPI001E692B80|nr:B3 domain-containing transcription factor VRN1-like [Trifolium pratense]